MGIVNYAYNRSTSGGEIIRELVNASDGQGLHFANGAALLLAYASGGVFGTADFSIEFILDQDSDNSSDNEIYTSQISGSNVLKVTNSISSNVVRISFDSTNYDIAYDMSGDYGTPTHYVLTCDRSALATLYKNGNSVGTINISGSSAVNLGNGNTANGYLGGASGYGVIGTYYRWRTWKKLLSAAEVTACYENASVPITDQWSNCVTDLDLAFANPERSLAVRSKSGVGNATASAGCFQLNPIEQLNSKSGRIGTTVATPEDGELLVGGKVGVGIAPATNQKLQVNVASGVNLSVSHHGLTSAVRLNAITDDSGLNVPLELTATSYNFIGGLSTFPAGIAVTTGGIQFPATQSASADANNLDDYEEGVFTPTISASSGAITTSSASGTYTRVGRMVNATYDIIITTNGTGAGTLNATLPFAGVAATSYATGRETVALGFALTGTVGATTVDWVKTSNDTYPAADGYRLKGSAVYQAA